MEELLKDSGFIRNDAPKLIDEAMTKLAFFILTTMAGASVERFLYDELCQLVIEYLGCSIDIFELAPLVINSTIYDPSDVRTSDVIKAKKALYKGLFTDENVRTISELSADEMLSILDCISENISELDARFVVPIIKCILDCGLLPSCLMYAYMASTLGEYVCGLVDFGENQDNRQ